MRIGERKKSIFYTKIILILLHAYMVKQEALRSS